MVEGSLGGRSLSETMFHSSWWTAPHITSHKLLRLMCYTIVTSDWILSKLNLYPHSLWVQQDSAINLTSPLPHQRICPVSFVFCKHPLDEVIYCNYPLIWRNGSSHVVNSMVIVCTIFSLVHCAIAVEKERDNERQTTRYSDCAIWLSVWMGVLCFCVPVHMSLCDLHQLNSDAVIVKVRWGVCGGEWGCVGQGISCFYAWKSELQNESLTPLHPSSWWCCISFKIQKFYSTWKYTHNLAIYPLLHWCS